MAADQTIAYISDVGAYHLRPLFIAGSAVTVVSFDIVFLLENWLRHRNRLAPHTHRLEWIFSIIACVFSVIAAAGLILLSIFDTAQYPRVHDYMLGVFVIGYVIAAIFICAEYQRLGIHQREYRLLRASFWLKLTWIFVFVALAIGKSHMCRSSHGKSSNNTTVFAVSMKDGHANRAAIFEWIIAFLFAIFVASFAIDFLPAVRLRHHHNRFAVDEPEKGRGNFNVGTNQLGGPAGYDSDRSTVVDPAAANQSESSRNF